MAQMEDGGVNNGLFWRISPPTTPKMCLGRQCKTRVAIRSRQSGLRAVPATFMHLNFEIEVDVNQLCTRKMFHALWSYAPRTG